MIQVYSGDGKGKTSAAIGAAVRMAGSGGKVIFTQFLKSGDSSEIQILNHIDKIAVLLPEPVSKFVFQMNAEEKEEARKKVLQHFNRIQILAGTEKCDMLVLDEILTACELNMLDTEEVLSFLKKCGENMEVILTGHKQFPDILDVADYVSEIRKIKHPFDRGISARKGIEM